MDHVRKACIRVLDQLESAVVGMLPEDFCQACPALGSATIGQHVRHTIEFFQCLERGTETGMVNYDLRAHDKQLETDRVLAIEVIQSIRRFVDVHVSDKTLVLQTCYGLDESGFQEIATTYFRELAYNLEHAVHHMAIIRIGVREVASYVELPADFGIAASTLKYRRTETASLG